VKGTFRKRREGNLGQQQLEQINDRYAIQIMRKKRKTKNKNKKQKKGCKNREKNLQKAKGKKCANTGYNPGQSGHIFLKWWYSSLRKKG